MYKKNTNDKITGEESKIVIRLSDNACIPFNPDNADYQKFKNDVQGLSKDFNGNFIVASELQDADGNVMAAEEAKAYIATLP